jgi:signal transduction histidine kinase
MSFPSFVPMALAMPWDQMVSPSTCAKIVQCKTNLENSADQPKLSLCSAARLTLPTRRQVLQKNLQRAEERLPHGVPADDGDLLENLVNALKQPLTSIRAAAEILRDNPDLPPEMRARFHAVVIADGERLDRLLDSWLRQASVDPDLRRVSLPLPPNPARVD